MSEQVLIKRWGYEVTLEDARCVGCGREANPNAPTVTLFNGYSGFSDLWNVAHKKCN